MEAVVKNAMAAGKHGQNEKGMMTYWNHLPQPSLLAKKSPPSVELIKDLLFDYHGLDAEAIAKITVDEEDFIHGCAKKEGEWYRFTIYKY
jgi:hypothetical protein